MEREEILKTALFEIKFYKPGFEVNRKDLNYEEAVVFFNKLKEEHPEPELQDLFKKCENYFGFYGASNGKGGNIDVYAYLPRIKTGEKHVCNKRKEQPMLPDAWGTEDEWEKIGEDRICSFCGSIHPDDLLALVKKHGFGIMSRTDKNYKFYIRRKSVPNASFGAIKYYTSHNTKEFVDEYNRLLVDYNSKTI